MEANGGVQDVIGKALAPVFDELGVELVTLTSSLADGTGAQRREGSAEVHYVPGIPPGPMGETFWRGTAAAFDQMHAERPFDLVFGRGVGPAGVFQYSRFSGQVPTIMHEGTYPRWLHHLDREWPRLGPWLERPLADIHARLTVRKYGLYRDCLRRADRVVCNSPALAQAFRRADRHAPPRTTYIPYGLDPAPYIEAARGVVPDAPPRIAYVGRLARDKGAFAMIDILAQVRDRSAILDAIGPFTPQIRDAMDARVRRAGLSDRVKLQGPVRHEDLPRRLAGATLFLIASTHPEGLSKAVMEAMAAGLAVVTYEFPGIRVLVEDGVTGFVVPTRGVAQAAERVERLLGDADLRSRMGAAARDKLRRDFDPARVTAQWADLFRSVLAERRR
ncbi:glycosyltransferase family 4 protein [Tabrizicola sp. BL-A-41-H6]|uniref:glycosyltransferase family 4 protein n=1 Tax=Tabrizicola sp. BL-A-41-H6 TaxID=3421107 RepID=UPI003D669757